MMSTSLLPLLLPFLVATVCVFGGAAAAAAADDDESPGSMFGWLFAPDYSHQLLEKQLRAQSAAAAASVGVDSLSAADVSTVAGVPYEVVPADEKFLQEAEKVSGVALSPQEKCQHKIFLSMDKSCGRLSEEEMSKVAVQLLNCQSEAEGRPQFACLQTMTIAECTAGMDSDTWNAYHIVSNRARAVCYAARQQQFRASAEIAVNRLTHQAFRQSERMSQLEGVHDRLQRLTSDTLQAVTYGQQQLIDQQDTLQQAQNSIQHRVADSLHELSRVRGAIGVGQSDMVSALRSLRRALAHTAAQLSAQAGAANSSQRHLAEQMATMHRTAAQLARQLQSVDGSTGEMARRLDGLMLRLQHMNATIHELLLTVEHTQHQLGEKIAWLNQLLGSDFHRVCGVLQQLVLLLCGMLVLTFVGAPVTSRLLLLAVVPLNLVAVMQQSHQQLQPQHLVALLLSATAVHYVTLWLIGRRSCSHTTTHSSLHHLRLAAAPSADTNGSVCNEQRADHPLTSLAHSGDAPVSGAGDNCGALHSVSALNGALHSPAGVRSRRLSTSSTASVSRAQCSAVCRNGLQCRNSAMALSHHCAVHARASRDSSPLHH